jgi:hypothetical protein
MAAVHAVGSTAAAVVARHRISAKRLLPRLFTSGSVPLVGQNKLPWPESASELYRPSVLRLSAKLVPTFADRGRYVVSVTNPYGRNVKEV